MNYKCQILKVIDHIGKNLDDELTIENLSNIAFLSKYHFHRLFTAYTGMSLQQYIRWLRLKRAAYQLIVHKEMPIINIAIDAGFESHEAFTRVFKQICGETPSKFRLRASFDAWNKSPYRLQDEGNKAMNVIIKEVQARRLAVLEHRGDPKKIGESVNKLVTWTKEQTIDVLPKHGETFAYAYDDPNTTNAEKFRFDFAVTVPNQLKISGVVKERQLPAGRYAVAMHKGSRENISKTVYSMYRDWLPNSGEELGDLPCIFCYYNFDHEVAETEALTECWLLLK